MEVTNRGTLRSIATQLVVDAVDPIVAVPDVQSLRPTISVVDETARVIASSDAATALTSPSPDLSVAGRAADMGLEVRVHDGIDHWSVWSPDRGGRAVLDGTAARVDRPGYADAVHRWAQSQPITFGASPLSECLTRVREVLGDDAVEWARETVSVLREAGCGVDGTSLMVLLGARCDARLPDVVGLCEDLEIASDATVSRRVSSLVDVGVVTKSTVMVQTRGRSPQRLSTSIDTSGSSMPNPLLDALAW